MARITVGIICLAIFAHLFVSAKLAVEEGVYIITSTDSDGKKLSLSATAPKQGKKLGDVTVAEFEPGPSFYWELKLTRGNWLVSLTPEVNKRNNVTEAGNGQPKQYRISRVSNTKYRIEQIVGRRSASCLRSNGPGKAVSTIICRADSDRKDPLFQWEFTNKTSSQ